MKTRRGKRGLEDQTDIASQITFAPPCGTFMHVFKLKPDHCGSDVVNVNVKEMLDGVEIWKLEL